MIVNVRTWSFSGESTFKDSTDAVLSHMTQAPPTVPGTLTNDELSPGKKTDMAAPTLFLYARRIPCDTHQPFSKIFCFLLYFQAADDIFYSPRNENKYGAFFAVIITTPGLPSIYFNSPFEIKKGHSGFSHIS